MKMALLMTTVSLATVSAAFVSTASAQTTYQHGVAPAQYYRQAYTVSGPVSYTAQPVVYTAQQPVIQTQTTLQPIAQQSYIASSAGDCCQPDSCCTPTATGYQTFRPVVSLGSAHQPVYFGRGILGQPKAYVAGQPVRNAFRYILP